VLKQHSFIAVTKKKKPLLTAVHRKKRLAFALKHREWTVEDWKRVMWSDETKINRIGSDGKQWVWKKAGDGLIEREVQGTVKFGGGNIMVWGCMGWNGVGELAEVEGRMDADQYVDILNNHLLPSMEESGIVEGGCIFQQDNDPKHTSKKAKNWMEENDITLLDWPAQSPDLNPIEHLWHHIKLQLCKYEEPPKGVWQIWERVAEVWNGIEPEVCQGLIESMPRRLEAVIKAKGGNTKY
jgi:transposase